MKKSRFYAIVLALMMLAGLTACTTPAATVAPTTAPAIASAEPTPEPTPAPPEPVTLGVLLNQGTDWNDFPDNPVALEIKRLIGVTINFVSSDPDKTKVLIAGGDLPDIINAVNDVSTNQFNLLIDGGNVIPLDDLLQTNGKNILAQQSVMLDFSRKYQSNGTGKLYYLNIMAGKEVIAPVVCNGPVFRWDYYKELGYPAINNTDDILTVIQQMKEKHPTTADGKPVYGISFWSDWGNWSFGMMLAPMLNKNDNVWVSMTDTENPSWKAVDFLYKANKMGLLDPDALVQGGEDMRTKATNGQVLFACVAWPWPFDAFNGTNAANGVGYMPLPLEWANVWMNNNFFAGYANKGFGITTNCKTPDRAMDLFNLLWSYDGARLVFSGVKGTHWDVGTDGKALENQVYIDMASKHNDQWQAYKIGSNGGLNGVMVGFNGYTINPADNSPVDLFKSEKAFADSLTQLQKDFSAHYGVTYPTQAFQKLVDEGKVKDQSSLNPYIETMMAKVPDDLATINGKADGYFFTAAAKCIMSKSDEEYQANVKQAIDDINAMGYQQYADWYTTEYNRVKATLGLK